MSHQKKLRFLREIGNRLLCCEYQQSIYNKGKKHEWSKESKKSKKSKEFKDAAWSVTKFVCDLPKYTTQKSLEWIKKFIFVCLYFLSSKGNTQHKSRIRSYTVTDGYGCIFYESQAYDLPARKSRTLRISCTYLLFFVKNCHNGS